MSSGFVDYGESAAQPRPSNRRDTTLAERRRQLAAGEMCCWPGNSDVSVQSDERNFSIGQPGRERYTSCRASHQRGRRIKGSILQCVRARLDAPRTPDTPGRRARPRRPRTGPRVRCPATRFVRAWGQATSETEPLANRRRRMVNSANPHETAQQALERTVTGNRPVRLHLQSSGTQPVRLCGRRRPPLRRPRLQSDLRYRTRLPKRWNAGPSPLTR